MTIRNKVRTIAAIPALIFIMWCVAHSVIYDWHPKQTDCGTIVSKSHMAGVGKRGRDKLYITAQFDVAGLVSVECEPTTYFKAKDGDYICFDLKKKMPTDYHLYNFLGVCFMLLIACALSLILISYLFGWI
jgi:hypothetical protein